MLEIEEELARVSGEGIAQIASLWKSNLPPCVSRTKLER